MEGLNYEIIRGVRNERQQREPQLMMTALKNMGALPSTGRKSSSQQRFWQNDSDSTIPLLQYQYSLLPLEANRKTRIFNFENCCCKLKGGFYGRSWYSAKYNAKCCRLCP